ncbi:MAG TPA: hypothetical protein ENI23_16475, partial [bacterium]|nr:hypothetical protein [bacterium]
MSSNNVIRQPGFVIKGSQTTTRVKQSVLIDVPTTTQEALILKTTDDSSTKNLFEVQDSTDTVMASIGASGKALFQNFTDSTTGFQILDKDGGTPIFNVDTTNERVGIGNNAPAVSLEVGDATGEEIIRVSSGANSNAILSANSFSSTGNPLTQYIVAGGNNWATGVDNADSDKYKISFHITDLGTN